MKNKITYLFTLFLAFVLGGLIAAYITVRYYTIATIEDIQIRSSSMVAYKAVATLELLRNGKTDAAVDFLEWQADDGLMGLSFYTSNPSRIDRLDSFSLETFVRTKKYRDQYPRVTKFKNTDTTISEVLEAGTKRRAQKILSAGPNDVMEAIPAVR